MFSNYETLLSHKVAPVSLGLRLGPNSWNFSRTTRCGRPKHVNDKTGQRSWERHHSRESEGMVTLHV